MHAGNKNNEWILTAPKLRDMKMVVQHLLSLKNENNFSCEKLPCITEGQLKHACSEVQDSHLKEVVKFAVTPCQNTLYESSIT